MLQRIALLCLLLSLFVTGCASLSKDECARANWDAIGYSDGSRGKLASRFNTHQKACAEHGFQADFAVYKDGHQRGLNEVFCKPRNGYQIGLRGEGYNNVCPSNLEQTFLPAYHYGRDIHKTQYTYNHLKPQVTNLKTQLTTVDVRIAKLRHEIKTDKLNNYYRSAQDLRKERGEATALYDRIKITRPRAQQTAVFKGHLRRELNEQNNRYERYVTRMIRASDLLNSERQTIRRIVRLSVEKGLLKSEINWVKSNPESARPRQRKTAILKRQHKDLLSKIKRQKNTLYRHSFNIQIKWDLESCFQQAEYAGILQHHSETLAYLGNRYAQNLLIDVHFDAEMKNLNQRIDFARHHSPSKEVLAARKNRHRELHDAQRQHEDVLHRIEELENKMGHMQRKIKRMKSANRY